jgi:hypothetical protein
VVVDLLKTLMGSVGHAFSLTILLVTVVVR